MHRMQWRGILSIETGRCITCSTLYEKLCTHGCEQCGDFGVYLYFLNANGFALCVSRRIASYLF
ncbi:hypothetical protein V8C37DRAFT_344984 [Trichoderma ceciliae]